MHMNTKNVNKKHSSAFESFYQVSEGWVDCLLEEYFHQSDKEKKDALPVAPFMDRDRVTKPTAQIGFIKYVLLPLFEALSKLYPEIEELALGHLREALRHYERKSELDEKRKKLGLTGSDEEAAAN